MLLCVLVLVLCPVHWHRPFSRFWHHIIVLHRGSNTENSGGLPGKHRGKTQIGIGRYYAAVWGKGLFLHLRSRLGKEDQLWKNIFPLSLNKGQESGWMDCSEDFVGDEVLDCQPVFQKDKEMDSRASWEVKRFHEMVQWKCGRSVRFYFLQRLCDQPDYDFAESLNIFFHNHPFRQTAVPDLWAGGRARRGKIKDGSGPWDTDRIPKTKWTFTYHPDNVLI